MTEIILNIQKAYGESLEISLRMGEILFVLGANGTGKSSLMQRFFSGNSNISKRIAAHRQTWFSDNAVSMSSADRRHLTTNIITTDSHPQSRYQDSYSSHRPNAALYDLINEQNRRARSITEAVDINDMKLANRLSQKDAPIRSINKLLRISNLPIEVSLGKQDELVAKKSDGLPYSITELSDGERNALLIAADILTVERGTLILLDEPERHLHRSIVSPLLLNLFSKRPDCYFVVSTHDLTLTMDTPSAQVLLLRDCVYNNNQFEGWQFDLLSNGNNIDDDIKKDILGARKKILFVEGNEHSLDRALYSLIFPGVSIVPKGSCKQIEKIVPGIRDEKSLNWVKVCGLIDNDRRPKKEIANLQKNGIYALQVYSVEAIYYHPDIQGRLINKILSETSKPFDPAAILQEAKSAALTATFSEIDKLSLRIVENKVREEFFNQIPNKNTISVAKRPLVFTIDLPARLAKEKAHLVKLHKLEDITSIIANYPVRETQALTQIANKLQFSDKAAYEQAVRDLLINDKDALDFVKSLFGSLVIEMQDVSGKSNI